MEQISSLSLQMFLIQILFQNQAVLIDDDIAMVMDYILQHVGLSLQV